MDIIREEQITIQPLKTAWYSNKVAALDMLRLDLVHPVVSGNKWYKLRLNVLYAQDNGFKTIVTFGGAYSNHLIATAYTARRAGLNCVGIVRGHYTVLTPTLLSCREEGMELIFVTKEDYERQHEPQWASDLVAHFDETFIIPEGGANEWGRKGAGLITRFIKDSYTHIAVSVGTGTTLAGLRSKIPARQHILGFAPMKGGNYLAAHITPHLPPSQNTNWQIFDNWHFGGFGKWNDTLIHFMNTFNAQNNIPLDIIYTSKMMYGVQQLINEGFFLAESKILCLHTGGLQGNVSIK